MPPTVDFRAIAFSASNIDASGRDIGTKAYWKLYAIENLVRVVIHSVLSAEIGSNWWGVAVGKDVQTQVQRFKDMYANQPWHSFPGSHDIYYTGLSDLNEIIRANSNLFRPAIKDIDQWIARIEQIRLPRNIVGHMNWPNMTDRQRIDVAYHDMHALVRHLSSLGIKLSVPN